nr:type II toxin-antitoxin system ParD family antitoxin [uncultured Devosia sp.]
MARNTSVSLNDHFADFIDEQVGTGNYGSPSDVVLAGLSLLEEQQAKVKALRDALREGEESGEPIPFDRDAFLLRLQARHAKPGD